MCIQIAGYEWVPLMYFSILRVLKIITANILLVATGNVTYK